MKCVMSTATVQIFRLSHLNSFKATVIYLLHTCCVPIVSKMVLFTCLLTLGQNICEK